MPFDFYSPEYEKGLELYSNGVLIMNKSPELLPDYFSFVKGMVDSDDLSLNISREMLQHDRQLKTIEKDITRRIKRDLERMLRNDREKYEEFYETFGRQLKYGVYSDFGQHKDVLQDLLLFYSSTEEKLVSLKEYVERMKADQEHIYYATGESIDRIKKMPQTEVVQDKGFEVLYFTEDVDEFAIRMLMNYDEKEFKSVSDGDLDLATEEEKEAAEKEAVDYKDLFDKMKEILDGEVVEVKASKRLRSHSVCFSTEGEISIEMEKTMQQMTDGQGVKDKKEAIDYKDLLDKMKEILDGEVVEVKASKRLRSHSVCFSTEGEISIEMEKTMQQMPDGQGVKANKVLEINTDHEVFDSLKS